MKKYFFAAIFISVAFCSRAQAVVTDSVETELGNFVLQTSENEELSEQDVVGDSTTTSDGGNAEYLMGIPNGERRIRTQVVIGNSQKVTIFPNPSSGITEVTLSSYIGNVEISLVDELGRVLEQNSIFIQDSRTIYIDITKYDRGIYFVKVNSQDGVQTKGLVKN